MLQLSHQATKAEQLLQKMSGIGKVQARFCQLNQPIVRLRLQVR